MKKTFFQYKLSSNHLVFLYDIQMYIFIFIYNQYSMFIHISCSLLGGGCKENE